jgi:uncharacterized protein (DUF1697 family)
MPRYVAFLRAINTPPRHVTMEVLRDSFGQLGLANVATYIASGNVIFETATTAGLAELIEGRLEKDLGIAVPVYLRSDRQVVDVADRRPFGELSTAAEISFLPARPDPAAVEALMATVTGEDRLAVIDREVHWYHPGQRDESSHKEATVVRLLGMPTTQRSARTVIAIADRFLR